MIVCQAFPSCLGMRKGMGKQSLADTEKKYSEYCLVSEYAVRTCRRPSGNDNQIDIDRSNLALRIWEGFWKFASVITVI